MKQKTRHMAGFQISSIRTCGYRRNSQSRMMIGIGMPSIHNNKPRNMSSSDWFERSEIKRRKAEIVPIYNARAASRTSAAWPGTFTLRHILAMRPSGPIRNVERSTPIYLRPYMLFSVHTP